MIPHIRISFSWCHRRERCRGAKSRWGQCEAGIVFVAMGRSEKKGNLVFRCLHIGARFVEGSRASFCPSVTTVPPRGSPPSFSNSLYLVILPDTGKDLALGTGLLSDPWHHLHSL